MLQQAPNDLAGLVLHISVASQELFVLQNGYLFAVYPISTSIHGVGQLKDSYKTPLGWHYVRAKLGAGLPQGSVFVSRRPTGEIYNRELAIAYPQRDWILSRILWLHGLEPGHNRGGNVDSMRRYIYIHGTADEDMIGKPASIGCIRMLNYDVIELFNTVAYGSKVYIEG